MVKLLALFAFALFASSAVAQDFPNKPLRIICAFPPGGPVDVTSRSIANELSRQFGQPVVVDNRPGAGGNIGAELAAHSAPDGYTLFVTWNALHSVSPLLYTKLKYDPNRDLTPVTSLVSFRQLMVVNPQVPANSVKELIALAKAQPGKLTYGSSGNGTVQQMAWIMFAHATGIEIVHVPYKGSAPALTDLMAGQITMMIDHIPSVQAFAKSGKLRGLATSGSRRDASFPDLPTIAEAGVPGFETSVWFGLSVPTGTPKDIIARLNTEAVKGTRSPEFAKSMGALGYDITPSTPEQMASLIKTDIDRWAPVVRASGAKLD
jgi:tripartite-type tricarboxylate transporter receptor subunit TctC